MIAVEQHGVARDRVSARREAGVAAFFVLFGLVVIAPWTQRGWLLLLDRVPGPHLGLAPETFARGTAITSGVPLQAAVVGLAHLVGQARAAWVAIALFFPSAGYGATRTLHGPLPARLAAGALFVCNPWVFDRLFAGQVGILAGYAVLPWLFTASIDLAEGAPRALLRTALYLACAAAMSAHFLFLGAAIALVPSLVAGRRGVLRRLARSLTALGVSALCSAYLFVSFTGPKGFSIGTSDLSAFRTRGDARLGLVTNIVGLHGFWRVGPRLPKDDLPGWPFLLAAVLAVCAVGYMSSRDRSPVSDAVRARSAVVLAVVGVVGAFGDQGPTGGLYRFAFLHVPGFDILREPGKWSALTALGYAVLFGMGVRHVVMRDRAKESGSKRAAAFVAIAGLMLPFVYTPSLAWGLAGRVKVSEYPSSWSAAAQRMGDGSGSILFLPWHAYIAFDFSGDRTIANPAAAFFARPVIQGDNIEVGERETNVQLDRSRYIEFCLRHGSQTHAFGALVAPLGVEFIAVARASDAATYDWLRQQRDLVSVFRSGDIEVFRNLRWHAGASVTAKPRTVVDWGQYFGGVSAGTLDPFGTKVRHLEPGPIVVPPRASPTHVGTVAIAENHEKTTLRAHLTVAGTVATTSIWDPSWTASGHATSETAGGLLAVSGSPGPLVARLGAWNSLRRAYLLSLAAYLVVLTCLTFTGVPVLLRKRRAPH